MSEKNVTLEVMKQALEETAQEILGEFDKQDLISANTAVSIIRSMK